MGEHIGCHIRKLAHYIVTRLVGRSETLHVEICRCKDRIVEHARCPWKKKDEVSKRRWDSGKIVDDTWYFVLFGVPHSIDEAQVSVAHNICLKPCRADSTVEQQSINVAVV